MSKKKTVKRTSAARTARKPKQPIDPRLQRVLAVVDEMYDEVELRDVDGFTTALWAVLNRYVSHRNDVKRVLTTAVKMTSHDTDACLDDLLELANREHRLSCACCRERHEKAVA